MNKNEFMAKLDKSLRGVPLEERKEILYDYQEHFRVGTEKGKTEEEIISSLGNPRDIGRLHRANYSVNRASSGFSLGWFFKAVLAVVALSFFNLVFILGPFLGLAGLLFGLSVATLAVIFAGLKMMWLAIIPLALTLAILIKFITSIGVIGLGILLTIAMAFTIKFFYELTISYLKWNIKLIKD